MHLFGAANTYQLRYDFKMQTLKPVIWHTTSFSLVKVEFGIESI